ncbi:MAG: tRNA (guanosine(37)-N1)-methyltransferase TrmD [Clostridia bacterium]|nr:tRNA (guanosine(37)-N1)-methyltransferase TrmD [Clostridia bacterium]
MRIDILTVFPEMFAPMDASIVKRARGKNLVELNITDIRSFALDKHAMTDDRLYGGGAGMVMKPEPICAAVEAAKEQAAKPGDVKVIITSPAGELFSQAKAAELAKAEQVIFVCGHYEGIDQRVEELLEAEVLSVGDFVLTGGELPAMIMAASVIRLLPGVLGDETSAEEESFSDGLLEYPQYTRPPVYKGFAVPEVLLSGNHEAIRVWRRKKALELTYKRRKDLLSNAYLTTEDKKMLEEIAAQAPKNSRVWISLLHYPVYNKKQDIINTSITNLDLHDIARAATTYDLAGYFIVQPLAGQKEVIGNLLRHWERGFGARYNPNRHEALARVRLKDSLEDVKTYIREVTGNEPVLIGTSAQARENMLGFSQMRDVIENKKADYVILLGTGWGLTGEILQSCDYVLRPIYGVGVYNHLSVRSAASIIMDRLLGEKS